MNLENVTFMPAFVRMLSHEPKEGYVWNAWREVWEEGDDLFRERIQRTLQERQK